MKKIVDSKGKELDPKRILYLQQLPSENKRETILEYGYLIKKVPPAGETFVAQSDVKVRRAKFSKVFLFFINQFNDIYEKIPRIASVDYFINGTDLIATYRGGSKDASQKINNFFTCYRKTMYTYYSIDYVEELRKKAAILMERNEGFSVNENLSEREILLSEIYAEISKINLNSEEYRNEYEKCMEYIRQFNETFSPDLLSGIYEQEIALLRKSNSISAEKLEEYESRAKNNQDQYKKIKDNAKEMGELASKLTMAEGEVKRRVEEHNERIRINYKDGRSLVLDKDFCEKVLGTKAVQDINCSKESRKNKKHMKIATVGLIVCLSLMAIMTLISQIIRSKIKNISENENNFSFDPKITSTAKIDDIDYEEIKGIFAAYSPDIPETNLEANNLIVNNDFSLDGENDYTSKKSK